MNIKTLNANKKVSDDLSICVLTLVPKVKSLPSLVGVKFSCESEDINF